MSWLRVQVIDQSYDLVTPFSANNVGHNGCVARGAPDQYSLRFRHVKDLPSEGAEIVAVRPSFRSFVRAGISTIILSPPPALRVGELGPRAVRHFARWLRGRRRRSWRSSARPRRCLSAAPSRAASIARFAGAEGRHEE